jgi:hypothetical protein
MKLVSGVILTDYFFDLDLFILLFALVRESGVLGLSYFCIIDFKKLFSC